MELKYYHVDAFASRTFGGNPAGVVPLARWLPDRLLQSIAAENKHSETAFFVPVRDRFHLRWFTPCTEVDLCGHATLATAHVLWNHLGYAEEGIRFDTRSGPLTVSRQGRRIVLDFPSRPPVPAPVSRGLAAALGARPVEVLINGWYLAVFDTEDVVRSLAPDFAKVAAIDAFALIATAPGKDVDFVSRFFAPRAGIDEDPVTGSAHCSLVPYWAGRLGRNRLRATQVSDRGGQLWCSLVGERVHIAGYAVTYMEGKIRVGGR
jgi:PhzF family phenazine biosynthesis protein